MLTFNRGVGKNKEGLELARPVRALLEKFKCTLNRENTLLRADTTNPTDRELSEAASNSA
jgi:hypothetical protein